MKPIKKEMRIIMSRIIAIANQKGGVGKTTTAINLASCLAEAGKKVLTIDLDPQGNMTSGLGVNKNELENTVYELMLDECSIKESMVDTVVDGMKIIPSNVNLAGAEIELLGIEDKEYILKNAVDYVRDDYDFIIIDCPPSLGMLTVNALSAADEVLIPVQTQYLPAKGMTKLLQTVGKVQRKINSNLKITGIVMTLADLNTNLTKSTIETIRESFGKNIRVFDTIIPKATKASEASISGKSIYVYAKDSKVALAYENLTKELINNQKVKHKEELNR